MPPACLVMTNNPFSDFAFLWCRRIHMIWDHKSVFGFSQRNAPLRGSDCKYRESADKLRKSKIPITCQKNTFGELSSKILLKPPGILLFSGNSEKFGLIYYAIIRLKIKQIENACFKPVCNARKQF